MMLDVKPRNIANSGWWVALTVAALSVLDACGGTRGAVVEDVTSPIAPYVDQEKLDTISEEEAATAIGAGELSHADGNRLFALQEVARRWAASSEPLWTSLLDPDAP